MSRIRPTILCFRPRAWAPIVARAILVAFLLAILARSRVDAQAEDTRWTTFTTQDGLISDNVLAIWGDEQAVWFGTDQGLSRYDGIAWQSFSDRDGLPGKRVQAIWGDGRGWVWVGTDAGLARYAGGEWQVFTSKDRLPSDNVRGIWGDGKGQVWVVTEPAGALQSSGGVAIYDGEGWRSLFEAVPYQRTLEYYQEYAFRNFWIISDIGGRFIAARAIDGDAQGNIWVGHGLALGDGKLLSGGINRYDGVHWSGFTTENSAIPDNNINALWVEPNGAVWIGTSLKGLCRFNGETWDVFGEEAAGKTVLAISGDGRGNIWVVSWLEGVTRYDGRTWTRFTKADGLGSDIVQSVWSDANGHVWFGTDRGAVLYSLGGWLPFRVENGLPTNDLRAVWGDGASATGEVWFGTDGAGLARYQAGQWQLYTERDGLPYNRVTDIWGSSAMDVWAAFLVNRPDDVGKGVAHFDGYRWQTLGLPLRTVVGFASVQGVWGDNKGTIWFATDGGLRRFDGRELLDLTTRDGMKIDSVTQVAGDKAGNLWVRYRWMTEIPETENTGYPGGIGRYDGRQWTYFAKGNGLNSSRAEALWVDEQNQVWAGGRGGLIHRFDGKQWQPVQGGPDWASAIWGDGRGNLWFGSDQMIPSQPRSTEKLPELESVVSHFDGTAWHTFTGTRDGLASGTIEDLWGDADGRVWAAHSNLYSGSGGASFYDGSRWQVWQVQSGPPAPRVQALTQDPAGHLWLGTRQGVSVFDGTSWRNFGLADGLVSLDVEDLWVAPTGEVWVAHALSSVYPEQGGVSRFDSRTWVHYTPNDGLGGKNVSAIWGDDRGAVWAGGQQYSDAKEKNWVARFDGRRWQSFLVAGGTVEAIWGDDRAVWFRMAQGANRYDGREWRSYPTLRGLVEAHYAELRERGGANPLWAVDADGQVWVAEDGAAARYDGRAWQTFTVATGLAGGDVRAIALDRDGTLWFATDDGLSRTDGHTWRIFRVANSGLGNDNVHSIHFDREGNLLFSTDLWYTTYTPVPPQMRIERLISLADGQVFTPAAGLALSHTQRSIQIEFSALASWTPPRDVRYHYRLLGVDRVWRFLDNLPQNELAGQVQYAELMPGAYTFAVAAGNRDLDYSEPIYLDFTIHSAPPAVNVAGVQVDGGPLQALVGDLYLAPRTWGGARQVVLALEVSDDVDTTPTLTYRLDQESQQGTAQRTNSPVLELTLQPGNYVLGVVAEDREGNRSPEVAVHVFVPQPRWLTWLPWLAALLVLVVVGAGIYAYWRLRVWPQTLPGLVHGAYRRIERTPGAALTECSALLGVKGPVGLQSLARLARGRRRVAVAEVADAVAQLERPETVAAGLTCLLDHLRSAGASAAIAGEDAWYQAMLAAFQAPGWADLAAAMPTLKDAICSVETTGTRDLLPSLRTLHQVASTLAGAQGTPLERQGPFLHDALAILDNKAPDAGAVLHPAEQAAFRHIVARWRAIVLEQIEQVMKPARLHGRLLTQWVLPADPVILALELSNRGQGVASNIRLATPPGGEIVANLPFLPPGQQEVVEFQMPLSVEPLRVAVEVFYDDRQAWGQRELFSGLVNLRHPPPWSPFKNPYVIGRPPEPGSPVFVGREDVFEFIRSGLLEGQRQNVLAIVGQRRMGKSSILAQLPGRLGTGIVCVKLDCQALGAGVDMAGLLFEIASTIGGTLQASGLSCPVPDLEVFRRLPSLTFERNFLQPLLSHLDGRRLLWLLDELEAWAVRAQQGRLDEEVFGFLRHLAEAHDALALLIAGTPRLYRFAGAGVSPLLNLAAICRLDVLDERAGRQLIVGPLRDTVVWDELAIARLLRLTAAHPYFLQASCWLLADRCLAERRRFVGPQDVETCIEEVWVRTESHLRELWEEGSALERLTLATLARLDAGRTAAGANDVVAQAAGLYGLSLARPAVVHALESLAERQILRQAGGERYTFQVPLYANWVRQTRPIGAVIEEVPHATA